jgi:hypothetical protein
VTSKPEKTPSADGKKAERAAEKDRPTEQELTENAPVGKPEGPDNLRRRAEWFRRRTGGAEK